ncbi:Scm-like with four MBT domains protein 1 [Trichinella pseudospiralis]|uniref:Scm-like with four MBT domains protein 1 n=1 Tax=Trichinella pseudospiralis TaxID=6337 RepID=A0A0V1FTV0_TRIPS|nr:Scm-like with four MBT domains protein 1 [Trichinella pseudospiralis]
MRDEYSDIIEVKDHILRNQALLPSPDQMKFSILFSCHEEQIIITSNPYFWSTEDLIKFLLPSPYGKLAIPKILELGFDGESFLMLSVSDMQEILDVKLGDAVKLCTAVEYLKHQVVFFMNQ